jgi:1-deoxy-D-xylulose-5-phosphate reductoisomerase
VKRIVILGSTGSIGEQTLDVVREHSQRLAVVGLVAKSSGEQLKRQAQEFGVTNLALFDESAAAHHGVPGGMDAIMDMVTRDDVDMVVVSVAGVIGLLPTLAAIRAGKQIALASKEVLVAAGELVMREVAVHGTQLTPIDSEHSAIFQCLQGCPMSHVERLFLTASGGPFRGWTRAQLESVTVAEALNHPTWAMGGKITIDSATLMNKGLELIEARWLFGVPTDAIDVVVHPQSVVHSCVKFADGSVIAQMGWPNMRLPIQYALLYPDRVPNAFRPSNRPTKTFSPLSSSRERPRGKVVACPVPLTPPTKRRPTRSSPEDALSWASQKRLSA